jgi:hypothetical protein
MQGKLIYMVSLSLGPPNPSRIFISDRRFFAERRGHERAGGGAAGRIGT